MLYFIYNINPRLTSEKTENLTDQIAYAVPKDYCHDSLLKSIIGVEGKLPPSQEYSTKSRFKLVQVHALLRHGDRAPSIKIDIDPNIWYECGMIDGDNKWHHLDQFLIKPNPKSANLKFLNTKLFRGFQSQKCDQFQLTHKGFRQHYATGVYMRQRYLTHLITESPLHPTDILIQSTNFRRTLHSSASFALGFIPEEHIKRSDVPIYTSPGDMLRMPPPGRTAVYQYCKNFIELKKQDLQKSGYLDGVSRFEPQFKNMAYIMNIINHPNLDVEDIFDNIWGALCHGLPLPCRNGQCITESMIAAGIKSVDWSFSHKYPEASSILAMQPFLYHSIFNEINIAINSKPDQPANDQKPYKFLFNFAHDSTLTSLLISLGIHLDIWLPFASRFIVEVWQDSLEPDNYYVRLLLNGQSVMEQLSAKYSKDAFELDGELLSYEPWKVSMMTGSYRDKDDYNSKCESKTLFS